MSTIAGDEERLALAAASGDRAAFARLLIALAPRFAAVIRAQNIPPADLDDVMQEAALGVWRALGDYAPDRPFAPWAVMIAANKARDWRRRRLVRAFWLAASPLEGAASARDTAPDPETSAMEAQALARARAAIADLPDALRQPLLLTAIAGFTHAQAAAALGVTPKAIETRIARARAALAKAVG